MGVDEHTLPDGQVWVKIDDSADTPVGVGEVFHTSRCTALMRSNHVGQVPRATVSDLRECKFCTGEARDSDGRALAAQLRDTPQDALEEDTQRNDPA
jgi:hypothetical protein